MAPINKIAARQQKNEKLIAAIRQGNENAFATFLMFNKDMLVRKLQMCEHCDEEAAMEVFSTVVMRMLSNFRRGDYAGKDISVAYVYASMANVRKDNCRTSARRPSCELNDGNCHANVEQEISNSHEDEMQRQEWVEENISLIVALANTVLSDKQREVLLFRLKGMSNEDIAEEVGVEPSVVAVRFLYAKENIRKALGMENKKRPRSKSECA